MKKLIILFVCSLFSLSTFAQESSPRLVVVTSNDAPTVTRIQGGVTADRGLSYGTDFSGMDALTIGGTLEPPPDQQDQEASIYIFLNIVGLAWFQLDTNGIFIFWNGDFDNLVPARVNQTLVKETDVTIIEDFPPGLFGLAGLNYEIHIGYALNSDPDTIIYNGQPMVANVAAMKGSETYYVDHIKGIIESVCLDCHYARGEAKDSAIQYLPSFIANNMSLNYQILSGYILTATDGPTLITSKATGGSYHGGGVQLEAGSDELGKLSTFIQMVLAESE